MDYKNGKCNIPFFYYEETQKQISKTGGREWKSKEEIEKEHAKYNTKGKANVYRKIWPVKLWEYSIFYML